MHSFKAPEEPALHGGINCWILKQHAKGALLWPAVSSPRRSTARAGHPSPSESLECGSLEAFLASDASAFVEHTKRCGASAASLLAAGYVLMRLGKQVCSGPHPGHLCAGN